MLTVERPGRRVDAAGWWRCGARAMGSRAHVLGLGGPPGAADVALRRLGALEDRWSRFRAGSELRALNADPRARVRIGADLGAALERALLAWELTDGRFDPTVHDALVAAGYDDTFEVVRDRSVPPSPGAAVPGCASIALGRDPDGTAVVERPVGVRLDLGGIGKGLAADLVVHELLRLGVVAALVSVGGDVRTGGAVPEGGWRIPVLDPFDGSAPWCTIELPEGGAVVTSSTRVRRWQTHGGGWAHHLVDPATGRPTDRGLVAAVVVAEDAWWAEALAKAAVVAGPDGGAELLERHGATGWLVLDDTSVVAVAA